MVALDHYPRIIILRKLRDTVQCHSAVPCLKNIKRSHTRENPKQGLFIPALRGPRQVDFCELEISLVYIGSSRRVESTYSIKEERERPTNKNPVRRLRKRPI